MYSRVYGWPHPIYHIPFWEKIREEKKKKKKKRKNVTRSS